MASSNLHSITESFLEYLLVSVKTNCYKCSFISNSKHQLTILNILIINVLTTLLNAPHYSYMEIAVTFYVLQLFQVFSSPIHLPYQSSVFKAHAYISPLSNKPQSPYVSNFITQNFWLKKKKTIIWFSNLTWPSRFHMISLSHAYRLEHTQWPQCHVPTTSS